MSVSGNGSKEKNQEQVTRKHFNSSDILRSKYSNAKMTHLSVQKSTLVMLVGRCRVVNDFCLMMSSLEASGCDPKSWILLGMILNFEQSKNLVKMSPSCSDVLRSEIMILLAATSSIKKWYRVQIFFVLAEKAALPARYRAPMLSSYICTEENCGKVSSHKKSER